MEIKKISFVRLPEVESKIISLAFEDTKGLSIHGFRKPICGTNSGELNTNGLDKFALEPYTGCPDKFETAIQK